MEYVAENVEYQELNFGQQLAEECPGAIGKDLLGLLATVKMKDKSFAKICRTYCASGRLFKSP
jgi:hypothetical protein